MRADIDIQKIMKKPEYGMELSKVFRREFYSDSRPDILRFQQVILHYFSVTSDKRTRETIDAVFTAVCGKRFIDMTRCAAQRVDKKMSKKSVSLEKTETEEKYELAVYCKN
jgi:hypothetical protein